MPEIRPLTLQDLSAVGAIEEKSFDPPWSLSQLESEFKAPGGWSLALASAGVLAAYVFCRSVENETEITRIAVAPASRRRGLGARLLGEVVAKAGARKERAIFLEVGAANGAALALYRRAGFEKISERKAYYQGRETALILRFSPTS